MAKEKKISIRFFLNKKLKPLEDEGVLNYPIYIHVNYNRNNTKFTIDWNTIMSSYDLIMENTGEYSDMSDYGYVSEEMFNRIIAKVDNNKRAVVEPDGDGVIVYPHEEGLINGLIDIKFYLDEILSKEMQRADFSVKGFSKRFNYYLSSPSFIYDEYLSKKVYTIVSDKMNRFERKKYKKHVFFADKFNFITNNDLISLLDEDLLYEINTFFFLAFFELNRAGSEHIYKWILNNEAAKGFYKFYSDESVIEIENDSLLKFTEHLEIDRNLRIKKIKSFFLERL